MPNLISSYDRRYPYVTFLNRQVSYEYEHLCNYWTGQLVESRNTLIGCQVSLIYNARITSLARDIKYTISEISDDGSRIKVAGINRWYLIEHFYLHHRKNEPPIKGFKKFAKEYL